MPFQLTLRRLLACAAIAHVTVVHAGPLPETCNAAQDNATLQWQVPSSLQPGVPARVTVRATNTTAFNRIWIGEEQKNYPYRLASWSRDSGIPNNQVLWSNWSCFGYNGADDPLNQRAFISDVATPTHPNPIPGCGGRTVGQGGSYDFSFDIMAPANATGSVQFSASMVYDAGSTCQGFFGDVKTVSIPVVSAPTCGTTDIGVTEGQWRLQVYNNEGLSGSPVEVRYVGPVGTGGFDFRNQWNNGVSQCAGREHYSTRLTRKVFFLAGNYDFTIYADDGYRLIVNGSVVKESWVAPQASEFHFAVTAPVSGIYEVAVEHFQATGGSGLQLLWTAQTPPTQPNPPGNLSATALGGGQIRLNWDSVSGISSYKVKRTTDSNPNATFTEIQTVSETTYLDSNLPDGTYYYVVTAVDSAGNQSNPSNRASATLTTTPQTCDNSPKSPIGDGWLVEIFNNRDLSGTPVEIVQLHTGDNGFNFPSSAMPPSQCVGSGNYSMRLTRQANFSQAGNYKFTYTADDGIRARINGVPFIDRWAEQVIVNQTASVQIASTGSREIVVEYFQATGGAQVALQWALDNVSQPPPDKPTGLIAVGRDGEVDLTWDVPSGVDLYIVKRKECIACLYEEIGNTSDGHFEDRGRTNGTQYTYVVQAWNFINGKSPDSDPASATPRSSAGDLPTLSLNVVGPGVAPVGTQLSLNSDGWASPNPLEVRMELGCPATRTTNCSGQLQAIFNSPDNRLRINGAIRGAECGALDIVAPSNAQIRWACPGLFGMITLSPGQNTTVVATLVVQPSDQTALNMNVSWGNLQASRSIGIPAAHIHPLIVAPGILGTMPPSYDHGEFDPQLGVYTPLMKQLEAIGYEEGVSLFRFPYDWRNSNHVTARYLRDRIRAVLGASRANYVTTDKVDILAHSMGGLITRVYMQGQAWDATKQNIPYGNDIRKVIFAASPHRGFPEDYKTYESNDWSDFLGDTPALNLGMNGLLWPALVKKHWQAANPLEAMPGVCSIDPNVGEVCAYDGYTMSHAANGGIDSLREMLPTPDVDAAIAPFFGPYICNSYPPCVGPYPFAPPGGFFRPFNPLLTGLNAAIAALDPTNLYVIYGTDPSPAGSIVNDTDVVFDVKAPPSRSFWAGWQNGQPEHRYTTPAGDDLIPEYSSNLKLLLPGIDDSHVAGFRVQNGVTRFGLSGPAFRHKEIMSSEPMQAHYVPEWLAGLGPIPFYQPYVQPDVVAALARGAGWVLFGECPVNLLLTDLQRNLKLGYDADTGVVYRDIPNSTYAAPNTENQFMLLGELPPGNYHLRVSAFGDGKFTLSLNQLNAAGTPRRWLAEDTVHTGDVREYDIVIGAQPPITRQPPNADAGPDQTVPGVPPACTADVQLDGSRSNDPDGEVLTYQWSGPFGVATGVQPTVKLPVGSHDITLLVTDGQLQGRRAHTHVTVTAPKPTINSVSATPSILEPADGAMRSVSVTVDVSAVCGTANCRIVDVDTDEGDKDDWKITGALTVKLRAERSPDGDGRHYKLRIECRSNGADPVHKSVTVKVPPPGRMKGDGEIRHEKREYKFKFDLSESRAGKDAGSVSLDVKYDDDDDDKHKEEHQSTDKFRATRVDSVRFSNDDDLEPGGSGIKVDTVKASGVGTWNGKSGYTFELRATDAGEPGAHHDRFKLVVRDAKGKSVAYVDEKIDSGNNQSQKPPK